MTKISDSNRTAIGVSNQDLKFKNDLHRFSFFKRPISNTEPYKTITIFNVFQVIKGSYFAPQTVALREIKDSKKVREFKAHNFDYVTFSGVFSKRNRHALIQHSGLIVIDFDHLMDIEVTKKKLLSISDLETQLLFTSPSGDGLKWVVEIDLTLASHEEYFVGIKNYLMQNHQLMIDQSGSDVARACFLCYDPTVYINPKYLKK